MDLLNNVLDCPQCGVMESGNHVGLHCPRTRGIWDKALQVAGEDAAGTSTAMRWAGMTRQSRIDHVLSSNELADRATEVFLRARATNALVSGLALADAALKVEKDPIRVQACHHPGEGQRRYGAREGEGGQTCHSFTAAALGREWSLPESPLTPAAQGAVARGGAPQKTRREDQDHPT